MKRKLRSWTYDVAKQNKNQVHFMATLKVSQAVIAPQVTASVRGGRKWLSSGNHFTSE